MVNFSNIKIISYNVRGINEFKKRRSIFNWIRKHQVHIAFLQETYSSVEKENQWQNEWGGNIIFRHGTKHSRGTAVLLANNIDYKVIEVKSDSSGRIIVLQLEIEDEKVCLINVYAPNEENAQIAFFNNLKNLMSQGEIKENYQLVIGGDFNLVLNPDLDKKGGLLNTKIRARERLIELIEEFNLIDVWRVMNPDKKRFTWRQKMPQIHCRLDYFLISDTLQDNTHEVDILPAFKSDHSSIIINLRKTEQELKGKGYWKFNNLLLNEETFVNEMHDKIDVWKEDGKHFGPVQLWEWIKYNIRNFCIDYSKERAKKRRDEIKILEEKCKQIEEIIDEQDRNDHTEYSNLKQQLEKFMTEKTEGTILRAKARWYEHGERSSKYFLNLEKRNYTKKTIKKLNVNGKMIENPTDILEAQKEFYSSLYKSSRKSTEVPITVKNKFLQTKSPTLSKDERNECEGKLSISECYKALKTFQDGKSPGNDGLTAEFYKQFWPLVAKMIVDSFNAAFDDGTLGISHRQAVITLIEKKGKDRTFLRNWRPISLLNVDYKIATKTIASRLKDVLPKLIHHNQSGFVKDRNIVEAIRTTIDTISYTAKHNIPGLLLFLDFEKAFDTVEVDFMIQVLEKYKFGEEFIRWIKVFYTDITSCVMNNGMSTGYFNVQRGVRQGDPLSPYLFILSVEILANTIRNDETISGIKIGKELLKLILFADDTTCFLSDKKSAVRVLKLVDEFSIISGLRINRSKSEIMWIGNKKSSKETIDNIPVCTHTKFLGVILDQNTEQMMSVNIDMKLKEISSTFNLWKTRGLTIGGRVCLAKVFGISKLNLILQVLPISDEYIKKIEKTLYDFVWKGKIDKVKRKILITNYKEGGLKMLDIKCIIKKFNLSWIQRYLKSDTSVWKNIVDEYLRPFGGINLLIHCNYDMKEIEKETNPFLTMVLDTWKHFYRKFRKPSHIFIWNNQNIKIAQKTIYYMQFMQAGMWYISDLYSETGETIPFQTWEDRGIEKKNFFKWRGILSSLKSIERNQFEQPNLSLEFQLKGKMKHLSEISTKDIYTFFISEIHEQGPSCKRKLEETFGPLDCKAMFGIPRNVCTDSKIHEMQFKINHNILATNNLLQKYQIKSYNTCDICHLEKETIEHLF